MNLVSTRESVKNRIKIPNRKLVKLFETMTTTATTEAFLGVIESPDLDEVSESWITE